MTELTKGIIFAPDFVMVPEFHTVGKIHSIYAKAPAEFPQSLAVHFWKEERFLIKNAINPNVYIGLTRIPEDKNARFTWYLPSVQVSNLEDIPKGYVGYTFPASLCARFRYIGKHHYYDINSIVAGGMYTAWKNYMKEEKASYTLRPDKAPFERIDADAYDGVYCQMEWFTPAVPKGSVD